MRKLGIVAVFLALLPGLVFANLLTSIAGIPESIHNSAILVTLFMTAVSLFTALFFRNRNLTVRLLMASCAFILISSTSCIWSGLMYMFAQSIDPCEATNCPLFCQTISLEKSNALKTDAVFPLEWISIVLIGISLVCYLYEQKKTGTEVYTKAIKHLFIVVFHLFSVFIIVFMTILIFLQILAPFILWIAAIVFIGAIAFTNEEKKPELQRNKYTFFAVFATLIGLAVLIYVFYVTSSPGFAFQCQNLVGYTDPCNYLYCRCP